MIGFLQQFHPVVQALLAGLFTWALTALGAATVFMTKEIDRKILDTMLGFAGGVMIAASYWSLLAPAIEMSEGLGVPVWFPPMVGFLLGGIFLGGSDNVLPHLHLGVAFGAVSAGSSSATLPVAIALAIGIGIQNFPEGLVISIPLRGEGMSRFKSFWYGQLSGIVEPIASVIGVAAVIMAKPILPYALSFAAGAMIFVVVEELIPESQRGKNTDLATLGAMVGFTVMMVLDVAFSS